MKDFREAVLACWGDRESAAKRARARGSKETGLRAGVTGGKHLDKVADLVVSEFVDAGLPSEGLHRKSRIELPGYFRAEKRWDVVAVHRGRVVAAVEFKSILGSFGNNLNNRTEEALGNALDLAEAGRHNLLRGPPPWLGYVFVMQDSPKSSRPVKAKEPHLPVDAAFKGASYQRRAAILLGRLLHRRLYDAAWFVTGRGDGRLDGIIEPEPDLSWAKFSAAIRGRVGQVLA